MKRMVVVLMNVWLGMQLGFGYVVAPILFAHLEKMTAGQLAGQLFHITHLFGLLAWLLALVAVGGSYLNRQIRLWVGVLLLVLAVNELAITPVIAGLKVGEMPVLAQWFGASFAAWHGVSSVLYLVQTVLGVILVMKLTRLQG